ncbi:Putative clathrin assembly protein At5g35200, partial [Linum perenne]
MANGSGSQKKIRQAIGALKDTTKVALKTLLIVHRSIRENDPCFPDELINYSRGRNLMLNLSHFRDSSTTEAWDYSAWIRAYALYLEERLECYRVMKYDINRDPSGTKILDTVGLFKQLPAMQLLLFRLLACKPEGASVRNSLIHYCLSIVGCEASSLYIGISNGIMNLVDKFFEMSPSDASRALDIYKRASSQASKLSDFFEICRANDFNHELRFVKIEQPPESFMTAMEDYVKQNLPSSSLQTRTGNADQPISPNPTTTKPVSPTVPNLFDSEPDVMDDAVVQDKSKTEMKTNYLKDKVVTFETSFFESPTIKFDKEDNKINNIATSQATSWELALVTAFTSDDEVNPNPIIVNDTLANGLDKATILEGLYEATPVDKTGQNPAYNTDSSREEFNPFGGGSTMNQTYNHQDPFLGSSNLIMGHEDHLEGSSFNMFPSILPPPPPPSSQMDEQARVENDSISSMECVGNPFIDSHYVLPSYPQPS